MEPQELKEGFVPISELGTMEKGNKIGSGGFGAVYKTMWKGSGGNRIVAVKKLKEQVSSKEAFKKELKIQM